MEGPLSPEAACLLLAVDSESLDELLRTGVWPHWMPLDDELAQIRTVVFYDCTLSLIRVVAAVDRWERRECIFRPVLTCIDELVEPVPPAFDGWQALGEGVHGDRLRPGVLLWHEAHGQRLERVLSWDEPGVLALVLARGIRASSENRRHPCWERRVMMAQGWKVAPCSKLDCPLACCKPVTP